MKKPRAKPRAKRFEAGKEEVYTYEKKKFKDIIVVKPQTEGQRRYINTINENDIVFCLGPAGTGKSIIPTGIALQQICADVPAYDKIVILRPAKEACDEKIGFLPGDMGEKMAPWAAPIVDNMQVFIDKNKIKNLFYEDKVEIIPLAYLRGRSLNKSFIIVDEAQNVSPKQMLMILTRLGKGSKMIINGDIAQTDIKVESGLSMAYDLYHDIEGIGFMEMDETDIVRHPLVAEIVKRHSASLREALAS